jgi:hypothetical protein
VNSISVSKFARWDIRQSAGNLGRRPTGETSVARDDLGERKHVRVGFERPEFLILEPDGPWLECFVTDISARVLPKTFILLLTGNGRFFRNGMMNEDPANWGSPVP